MNQELIRHHLTGPGQFVIRTSDGKEFSIPHSEFVLVGRRNLVVEQQNGFLDIIDPMHVVSIRPGSKRKSSKTT